LFSSYWNDLRYAARTLSNNPGFAAIAILALALGIGVNTGIFSMLNSVALRPLPVPRAEQLTSVYQTLHSDSRRAIHGSPSLLSTAEYETYRDQNQVFDGLLAYAPFVSATLGGETPRSILGQYASCNYFDVLDEPVALGRAFLASDCLAAGSAVAVLSDDLWHSAFHADPSIAGKTVLLNGRGFTIAGVAPAGFHGTEAAFTAFWVPLAGHTILEPQATFLNQRDTSWLVLTGRTKSGIPLAEVRADLSVIAARIDSSDASEPGRKTTLTIEPATFASLPEVRSMVTGVGAIILAAVGLVLLVACANVANLLLARAGRTATRNRHSPHRRRHPLAPGAPTDDRKHVDRVPGWSTGMGRRHLVVRRDPGRHRGSFTESDSAVRAKPGAGCTDVRLHACHHRCHRNRLRSRAHAQRVPL
jgi:hypothetical protein